MRVPSSDARSCREAEFRSPGELPFLLGELLIGCVDRKSDRQDGHLIVRSVHLEQDTPPHARKSLRAELGAWPLG